MSTAPRAASLPSRYEQVLNQRCAEAMKTLRDQSNGRAPAPKPRLWKLIAGLGTAALAAIVMNSGASAARSTVPFAATNTVQVMGLSNGVRDFMPPAPAQAPAAPAAEEAAEEKTDDAPARSPVRAALPPANPRVRAASALAGIAQPDEVVDADVSPAGTVAWLRPARKAGDEAVLFDEQDDPSLTIAADRAEDGPRRVVNVGTRFAATLIYPVRTGGAPVPVAARVVDDVRVGEQVVIRAGATLVGSAIATRDSNRVQVAFHAFVQDGLTMRLQGLALGTDGDMGVVGKVLRKASTNRKWGARAVGAVGAAASIGLARKTSGAVGTAAREIADDVDRDFDFFERTWGEDRTDKVIEARAGEKFVVCLNADLDVR